MAIIDDLDKKYRELFPETIGGLEMKTTDVDQEYLRLFEPEKYKPGEIVEQPKAQPAAKPIGLFSKETFAQLPSVLKEIPQTVKEKIKKIPETIKGLPETLKQGIAEFSDRFKRWDLGLAPGEPIPEQKWIWEYTPEDVEKMKQDEREKVRKMVEEQEFLMTDPNRQKRFEERIKKEFTESPEVPKEYKEPTTILGQFWEGLKAGWESTVQPAIGYSMENLGRIFGSKKLAEWGEEQGTKATIDFLKKPQLMRPEDLKPFTEGGWHDSRWYGRVVGETLPFSLTAIGGATLGGLIGGPPGAYAGGFGVSFAVEQANSYQRMLEEGIPTEKALVASNAYGSIAALIENMFGFSPARIGGNIAGGEILKKVVVTSYKDYLITALPKIGIEILKKASEEGGEEIAQGIAENLAANWVGSNREIFTKDLVEEFAAGFFGSLPLGVTEIKMPSIEIQRVMPSDLVSIQTPTGVLEGIKKPLVTEAAVPAKELTYAAMASLISEGKSSGEISLPSQRTSAEDFTRLKVRDALSKISATKTPFSSETLKISPSDSKNFADVVSAINKNLTLLSSLYEKVDNSVKPFLDILTTISQGNKVEVDVKGPFSAVEKIISKRDMGKSDYWVENLNDLIRARVIFASKTNLKEAISNIKDQLVVAGITDAKLDDYFLKPNGMGYRALHIDIKLPTGVTAEIQLHTAKSLEAQLQLWKIKDEWKGKNIPVEIVVKANGIAEKVMGEEAKIVGVDIGKKIAYKEGAAKAYEFFSPNIEENLTFEEAKKRLDSDNQAALKSISDDIDGKIGLTGTTLDVIGDWSDGAENSLMTIFGKGVEWETLRYSIAQKGLIANQKVVIPFLSDEAGPDTLYALEIPEISTMEELRKGLDELGLQYRTIVSENQAIIFDSGSQLTENLNNLQKKYGTAIVESKKGKGEFLGGETRAAGRKIFQEVVNTYEEQFPERVSERKGVPLARPKEAEVKEVPAKEKAPALGEVFFTVKEPVLAGITGATIGKFKEDAPIEAGHLQEVNPIEFPELVELSRELSGAVPAISKRLRTSLGKFYAVERGRIKLNPEIFKVGNEGQLAKVLAHEIGHLVDYLPEQTLRRGNLLGSLLSLRGFLKDQFGDVEITNKEIRAEIIKVSEYWRPYETAKASQSYIGYRNSARELYADAISVLFNTPGTLERLAPTFFKGFFNALDAKPEVKNTYFNLQEVLAHDRATLIALRRTRTKEMFERADYKAEELQKVQEQQRRVTLKDYWNRFTYAIKSINQPIYNKVNEAEAKGVFISDDVNPKYLLSARNYLSGRIKADFEDNVFPISKNLEKNGVDWKTFGEFLLYERITAGDRSEFANPGGITPSDATERINAIKTAYGDKVFKTIEDSANKFRQFLKKLGEEAHKEGLFSTEMFDLFKGNEKYVPFQVVEYMENYVSWKAKAQIGTLKDINNPANSLMLKAISTIRAIENQKIRTATFDMLEKSFPKEIKDAELQFTGRAQRPMESREEGMEMVTYYKDGKLRGKVVDQYIARSLERDSISRNRAVMTVLSPISYLNQKLFRPLFVIYNPGWIPFNFIRDYMRFWKNTPGLSMIGALKRYGQAFQAAKVRAFGISKTESKAQTEAADLVRKLEREKILSVTWNDLLSGQTEEDAQIEAELQKFGLAEKEKKIPSIYKPIVKILQKTKIISIIQGIRKVGDLVETLPKIAGYFELAGKMPPNQMREYITKNIGSPDFFEKGYLTPATNNIFLFSNAFIQAVSADASIATNPTTRSGFWFKTAKLIYIPKILMFAGLMGAFGEPLKKLFDDASEYDMTNYFVIPLGRDSKNGKTVYLRIPMDETSRLLGGVLWKTMRVNSNDQSFGRDMADLASLFGGQLPSLTPSISAPISALQFAAGQNPYDSFRGRMVLTEEQIQAGGWYAAKPFLLWEFQQMGANVFYKFYAGEQTPTEKSPGEAFLSLPILSNIVGRFVRISDYGQLEKYRQKLQEIKGEKARERIDEDKLLNEYIKKYQNKEGDVNELGNDLIAEVLGHTPRGKEEMARANNIRKKFRIGIKKGESDPKINAMISAISIEEKVTLMRVYQEIMSKEDFEKLRLELLQNKIISTNVIRELNKPFQP